MFRKLRFVILFVLSIVTNICSQSQLPADLDKYIEQVLKEFQVPGVSVAVIKDGETLLTKGYGTKELGKNDPVDENTLFGIASNSKAFTATALAILVERGMLEWDKPVVNYIPWFQLSDHYITRETTVRDLLVHRIGLDLGAGDLLWWPESEFSREDIVKRLKYLPFSSGFRSQYAYDNVLYIVAGVLIKEVTGFSWEDFVEKEIFQKLGMNRSKLRFADLLNSGNVSGTHAVIKGKIRKVAPFLKDNANPAAGINSTASDLAKWMRVQMDSGRVSSSERLFSPKTTEQLWGLVTPIPVRNPVKELAPLKSNFRGYALGFGLRDYRGLKMVSHSGALPGYYSLVTMIPDLKIGVAVLTNAETGEVFSSITNYIVDYLINAPKKDWLEAYKIVKQRGESNTSDFLAKLESERNKTSVPSLPLSGYAGVFTDDWYGDIVIELTGDKLIMKFSKTKVLAGELEHWQYNTFVVRWYDPELRADAFVNFHLTPSGKIDFVKMEAVSPDTDFSFDFHHLTLKPKK